MHLFGIFFFWQTKLTNYFQKYFILFVAQSYSFSFSLDLSCWLVLSLPYDGPGDNPSHLDGHSLLLLLPFKPLLWPCLPLFPLPRSPCGSLNNGPKEVPCLNLWNCDSSLHGKRNFAEVFMLRLSRRGDYSRLSRLVLNTSIGLQRSF